ncbi:sterol desaturase family protein [Novosphingobium sp. 1949]|uniref:Sterol desaturase family protein n=1 Tax=Novosphingobium organovorum TaxID=2930092 RepID=A0ABT0BJ14_9SPHN|nr:sterol desaturase family protein [Novosphingobium organovorum]MCJ2185032.1 sterol desaturase family protein [Novosphingobium organovorum]
MRLVLQHPVLLIPILLLVLVEIVWRRRNARGYDRGGALASLGVALGQAVFRPLGAVVIGIVLLAAEPIALFHFPSDAALTWIAGFFAVDFVYYWFHRFSHTVRWLWATHAVHHSAAQYVLPSAVRLGWTELFSLGWLFYVALVLIGFPPLMIGVLLGANLLYQFPLHTEMVGRLGPLEAIFNTPSHHRAHHASEAAFLDCNFGGVLIVWDRLFGTFRAEPDGRALRYGLVHALDSHNPLRIAGHEWLRLFAALRTARGLGAKLRIALGRP